MFGVVFWRGFTNFSKRSFIWNADITSTDVTIYDEYSTIFECSFAEFGQVTAGTKLGSFLTPDMASKNDARHGIGLYYHWLTAYMSGIVFFMPCLASKSSQTLYPQSLTNIWQMSLYICSFVAYFTEVVKLIAAWKCVSFWHQKSLA